MQEPEKEDVQSYNILAREAAQVCNKETPQRSGGVKWKVMFFHHNFQLSGRYEALTKSMSEVASIPPSWSILAEVNKIITKYHS